MGKMSLTKSLIDVIQRNSQLQSDSPTPLYQRIQSGLRYAIDSGVLQAGDAIPSERELAAALDVSRVTIRAAVRGLVQSGLLAQKQGAGTFVSLRMEQPLSRLTSFTEDMQARGVSQGIQWIDRSISLATPQEAMALNLSPGSRVSRLYRIRSADDKPIALEQTTLPLHLLPNPLLVDVSLYSVLDQSGNRPVRSLQHIRAQLCRDEHAKLLRVPVNSAVLYIERRSFTARGVPVEFTRSQYRGDSYDFVAELRQ